MTFPNAFSITRRFVAACAIAVLTACGSSGGSGTTMVSVPNVTGSTQAAATTSITAAGLTLGTVTMQSSNTVPSGNVISETPAAAANVAKGTAVALVVSTGPAAMVAVPNVVGDTQAAATAAITGAGLTLGAVTMQSSGTVASGNIISENPAAATNVASGSAVAIVVSSGVAMVAVPNVVGDTQAAATTAITGAGLILGAVTMQSSGTVASGSVISENPAAATSVASGSAVAIVVSSGVAMVAVPNVVGDTQAAATTAITGAGLTLGTVTMQSSGTVASGKVISENPAAATSVASGSAVGLVVSTGAATYTIGGTVIGLKASATVHVLNGQDDLPVNSNGGFTLPTAISNSANYAVTVGTAPTGQSCAVQNGTGTVAGTNVTNVLVYCTYNVSAVTLNGTYDFAGYNIDNNKDLLFTGVPFDGNGNQGSSTVYSDTAGTTFATTTDTGGPYTVVTTNAIALLTTGGNNIGAIAGADNDEFFWLANTLGQGGTAPPALAIGVKPMAGASAASLTGTWISVALTQAATPYDSEGPITINADLSSSVNLKTLDLTGTAGTQSQSNPAGSFSVTSNGQVSAGGNSGFLSANGNFVMLTFVGSPPGTAVAGGVSANYTGLTAAVKQGTGVTLATLDGVYAIGSLAFDSATTSDGEVFTIFFDGAGNYTATYTQNNNGTVTTGNIASGTYTVTATGVLTITARDGSVQTGGVSADGNIIVAASLTAGGTEQPRMFVGVRQ